MKTKCKILATFLAPSTKMVHSFFLFTFCGKHNFYRFVNNVNVGL